MAHHRPQPQIPKENRGWGLGPTSMERTSGSRSPPEGSLPVAVGVGIFSGGNCTQLGGFGCKHTRKQIPTPDIGPQFYFYNATDMTLVLNSCAQNPENPRVWVSCDLLTPQPPTRQESDSHPDGVYPSLLLWERLRLHPVWARTCTSEIWNSVL